MWGMEKGGVFPLRQAFFAKNALRAGLAMVTTGGSGPQGGLGFGHFEGPHRAVGPSPLQPISVYCSPLHGRACNPALFLAPPRFFEPEGGAVGD